MKRLIIILITFFSFAKISQADVGIPLRLKLKAPNGEYPTVSNLEFRVRVLSTVGSCILREEIFHNQTLTNGNLLLTLGTGDLGVEDPGLSLVQIFDNTENKANLDCVNANDVVINSNQLYIPSSSDHRIIRVLTIIDGAEILVNFGIRSAGFAVNAASVGGIPAANLLKADPSTSLSQVNLADLLLDVTHFNNLKSVAMSGSASISANPPLAIASGTVSLPVATSSAAGYLSSADWTLFNGKQNSIGFTPLSPMNNLSDVSSASSARTNLGLGSAATMGLGTTNGTVAAGDDSRFASALSVVNYNNDLASANCSATETLSWNSGTTSWSCQSISFPTSAVTSVAGKSGVVSLVAADVSGLGTAATLNAGTSANDLVQLNGGGLISSAVLPTSLLTTSTSFLGDVSGVWNALQVTKLKGIDLDNTAPTLGQVLRFDGTAYVPSNTALGTVTSVGATPPLASSGGTTPTLSMPVASSTVSGYLSSTDWTSFNTKQASIGFTPLNPSNNLSDVNSALTARSNLGLGGAATLSVGTAAGTVAAGNDSRIVGALSSSVFVLNSSNAACSTTQTAYWNSGTTSWDCQNISFPVSAVTSVAGKTGAVSLAAADVSGLGTAATLNAGTAASNLVQLDGAAKIPVATLPTTALTSSTSLSGDVTGTSSTTSVTALRGVGVSATAPTAGQALVYNGTSWVPTTGFSFIGKKVADQTFSVVALAAVTNLVFNVSSGVTYKFKFLVPFYSAATTTGLRLSLTYPAATLAVASVEIPFAADGAAATWHGTLNVSTTDTVVSTGVGVASVVYMATVEGVITPTASGTVQLNAGSEVAASNVVITTGATYEFTATP